MQIGIDIGGTFTDFVVFDARTMHTFKALSTPHAPADAVLNRLARLDSAAMRQIVHGSTVATNAILERKGAITALITTQGFGDVLEIGRQNRPDLYDLFSRRPTPLVPAGLRFEIAERVDSTGQPRQPLDPSTLPPLVEQLRTAGVASVAVSLLFSFLYPQHEQDIAAHLREAGFFVSTSSEVLPEFREYERTSTTVVNAYVSPVMDNYLAALEAGSNAHDFRVMQSNGGSISATQARREAVRCVLSGPAGGVVGARYVAQAAGLDKLITFDMGGTSTDVSLGDGDFHITTDAEIGGFPIRVPVLDIHTVGSGGGSMAYLDQGGALRVGPQSAGANPGPICYGQGGTQPTVTDANLILGRLAADHFLGGEMHLDVIAAETALTELAQQANLTPREGLSFAQRVALGILEIANAHMERALRVISVQRGYDPRDFTLVSFGGAGGLHAANLARGLRIPQVLIPPMASVLSAFGMLAADIVKDYSQTVMQSGDVAYDSIAAMLAPLVAQGQADLQAEGVAEADMQLERWLDMRYRGQSYELRVPFSPDFAATFHAAHESTYGYNIPGAPLELVNVRVRAIGRVSPPDLRPAEMGPPDAAAALFDRRPVVTAQGLQDIPFYHGHALQPGHRVDGPALVVHPDTTIFIEAGDQLHLDAYRNIIITVSL